MGDRKRRLSRAIDALALRVEHGALLAATDPAELLESAVARIRELEARAEQAERELDRVRVDLVTAQHAIGEGWFAGGADTATAIERKTKALEDGARDAGARAAAAEERLAALTQAAGEAAETLDALIYWHDCGDIDRSWWEDAREKLATLRAAMGETNG